MLRSIWYISIILTVTSISTILYLCFVAMRISKIWDEVCGKINPRSVAAAKMQQKHQDPRWLRFRGLYIEFYELECYSPLLSHRILPSRDVAQILKIGSPT
jgi:hypothetical protein